MANFEGLHWRISFSMNLLFLKSAIDSASLTIQGDPLPTTEFLQSPYIHTKIFCSIGQKSHHKFTLFFDEFQQYVHIPQLVMGDPVLFLVGGRVV